MKFENIKHYSKTDNYFATDYQGWVYFGRESIDQKDMCRCYTFVNKINVFEGIEISFISTWNYNNIII